MPRFIRLDENNMVIVVRIGPEIVPGEIQSDIGGCGDIMQTDGTFITPEPIVIPLEPNPLEVRMNQLETVVDTMLNGGIV